MNNHTEFFVFSKHIFQPRNPSMDDIYSLTAGHIPLRFHHFQLFLQHADGFPDITLKLTDLSNTFIRIGKNRGFLCCDGLTVVGF